jgi:hypothetical protein
MHHCIKTTRHKYKSVIFILYESGNLFCSVTFEIFLLLLLYIYILYINIVSSFCGRILLWHIDPSTLKHEFSALLQEAIRRPLLCLRKELHDRMAWRVLVICLVCSPLTFMEMRSLFHTWFLVT